MSETLEQQLLLHDAAMLCNLGLLRAAMLDGEAPPPIVGEGLDKDGLLRELAPALDLAWPDGARDTADLGEFLREAYGRVVKHLNTLSGEDGFVPAALWTDGGRELLLDHLREEVDSLIGGVRSEGLWFAFGETGDTAPLVELIHSGILIKVRAVGAFLVLKPSRRDDELTAADFFQVGAWEAGRDTGLVTRVLEVQGLVHKQIAHLTITRPRPDEKHIYRPSTYSFVVGDMLTLLEQFTKAVDARLLPEWWMEWVAGLNGRLSPDW